MRHATMHLISAVQTLKASVRKRGKGCIVVYSGGKVVCRPGGRLVCEEGSKLIVNQNILSRRDRVSTVRIDENAEVRVRGRFSLYYDCDIVVFPGGSLSLGSGYINSGLKLRCANRVEIGDGVPLATDLTLLDSDHHSVNGEPVQSAPIIIEDHVWIGTRVTILKGVTIGEGSIVAAGSLVTRDVPPHSLAMGVPAKVVKTDVYWS